MLLRLVVALETGVRQCVLVVFIWILYMAKDGKHFVLFFASCINLKEIAFLLG